MDIFYGDLFGCKIPNGSLYHTLDPKRSHEMYPKTCKLNYIPAHKCVRFLLSLFVLAKWYYIRIYNTLIWLIKCWFSKSPFYLYIYVRKQNYKRQHFYAICIRIISKGKNGDEKKIPNTHSIKNLRRSSNTHTHTWCYIRAVNNRDEQFICKIKSI